MRNLILLSLSLMIPIFSAPSLLNAQTIPIVEDDESGIENTSTFSLGEHLSKSLSGQFGVSYSGLVSDSTRQNAFLKARYAGSYGNVSYAIAGRAYNSEIDLNFDLINLQQAMMPTAEETTIERTTSADDVELREAYLKYTSTYANIYLGRQTLTLGQFDLFSPIDFLLPIDFSNTVLSFEKADNRLPQDIASLILYSPFNIELQLHHIDSIAQDPLSQSLNDELTSNNFIAPSDEAQSVVRLLYTGDRFTLGLTSFDGFSLFSSDFSTMNEDYSYTRASTFGEKEAVGLELSYPHGNYTWKLEVVKGDAYEDLSYFENRRPQPSDLASYRERIGAYQDWIRNNNQNNLFIKYDELVASIGFDYIGNQWNVNFGLIIIQKLYEDTEKRGVLLESLAYEQELEKNSSAFPVIHASKTFGANASSQVGFGLGMVGFAQGITTYYKKEQTEKLTWSASLDIFQYLNDSSLAQSIERDYERANNQRIELDDSLQPSLRIALLYAF